jgi:hypothetical protein
MTQSQSGPAARNVAEIAKLEQDEMRQLPMTERLSKFN